MFDYDPKGERATRDVVSRGIFAEMRKSNTSEHGGVYISMAHLGPENVRAKFPGMVKRCADSGFDLAAGKVEVVPTAHYFMGGVVVDPDTRTAMEGLYVAGEDAGGAHGSNRLGGNGVANSTVYGGVAGDVMGADIRRMGALRDPDETVLEAEIARALRPLSNKVAPIQPLRDKLQDAMWEDVGVMRTQTGLARGLTRIADIHDALLQAGVAGDNLAFNLTWHDWLNMASLCEVSEVIAKAGLARENSRGAHFREDFPDSGAMESSYFTVARQTGGTLDVSREAVQFTIVKPGETILPENEPVSLVEAAE
jgi:Aspartate oxidase